MPPATAHSVSRYAGCDGDGEHPDTPVYAVVQSKSARTAADNYGALAPNEEVEAGQRALWREKLSEQPG